MYKNSSPQTKSFIILFCIAAVGTYLTFMLTNGFTQSGPDDFVNGYRLYYQNPQNTGLPNAAAASQPFMPQVKPVDTSAWKTYSDKQYAFSFRYDPSWSVLPGKKNKDGFYVLEIDPGQKFYNIKIFVNDKSFFALEGLSTVTQTIAGRPALNVSNLLYGMINGPYYYTFDNGLSTNMIDGFNAMVHSVSFQ